MVRRHSSNELPGSPLDQAFLAQACELLPRASRPIVRIDAHDAADRQRVRTVVP